VPSGRIAGSGVAGMDRTPFTSVLPQPGSGHAALVPRCLPSSSTPSSRNKQGKAVVLTCFRTFNSFISDYMDAADIPIGGDISGSDLQSDVRSLTCGEPDCSGSKTKAGTKQVWMTDEMLVKAGFPQLVDKYKRHRQIRQ